MMQKIIFVLTIFISCICFHSKAQTQLSVTSFPYAIQLFNPSYVGTEEHVNVSVFNKTQWLNTAGAPSLIGVTGHIPFSYERMGAGLNLLKEETATIQSLYMNANASYKINFRNGRLSFGIRLGMLQRNENLNGLLVKDQNDVLLTSNNQLLPEFGGGLFYKQRNLYTGLSFVRSAGIYLERNARLKNYYHFVIGGSQRISPRLKLEPALKFLYTGGFNPYAVLLVPVKYDDLFSVGLGYGTASVVSFVAALNIDKVLGTTTNKYVLSYAYDQSMNKQTNYIGNTHELILSLKLVQSEKAERILRRKVTVSPLFFD